MSISNGKTSSDIENVDWNSSGMLTHTRYGSTSSQVSQSSGDICRICHCESDTLNPLLTPCYCSGSLKFVHQTCLQQWLTASETNACELCKFPFIMHTKIKPFNEWRSLDMSGVERRRLCCAVLFHCAAGLCVIWSLCVLIERAAEEVRRGQIGWPFWTKLIVVTVGLTGGVVFMYIQCKQYLSLCNRWRARNRILLIQNAPEKIHPPQSPQMPQFRRVRTAATSGQQQQQALQQQHPFGAMGINAVNNAVSASAASAAVLGSHHMHVRSSFDHPLGTGLGLGGSAGGGGNHCELQLNQQGQIIAANIESNSIDRYDRDWTLDDISQVSFKPCLQGSGSLTPMPFHDSLHNVCESNGGGSVVPAAGAAIQPSAQSASGEQNMNNSSNTSSGSGGGPELSLLNKLNNNGAERSGSSSPNVAIAATTAAPGTIGRYVNSAIFLENRDILNDPSGPGGSVNTEAVTVGAVGNNKLYHRHSTVLAGGVPPSSTFARADGGEEESNGSATGGQEWTQDQQSGGSKAFRRYSDTKLLQKQTLSFVQPSEPLALCEIGTHTKDQLLLNPKSIIYDMTNLLGPAVIIPGEQDGGTNDNVSGAPGNHRHHHSHHHHGHHHHLHHHRHHHPYRHHQQQQQQQHSPADRATGDDTLPSTDIQFDAGVDDDALEMNIQEILDYDQQQQQQQHFFPNDRKHTAQAKAPNEQRLSLENILQASYHDDPSTVPSRPYYDHGHAPISLSLSSKTPPGGGTVSGRIIPSQQHPHQQPALSSFSATGGAYPHPRSTMAGTIVVSGGVTDHPLRSPPVPEMQSYQHPAGPHHAHPQLQQQRSHCNESSAGTTGHRFGGTNEGGTNSKHKLFKSLPNLSASSENLLP
ncbi:homeotic protein proboscipedia [Anopheles ziemanni]|uniref:homeotic protein proboscipedia n=1 Tax=Anopheles coustani TaxID=139045 RepID=UPI002659EEC9|nr:homeotic protein proboscipedia [Anopheles coustani]XP_058171498.1 homeotic protein proboscipedia [Anopheles ziemanni]